MLITVETFRDKIRKNEFEFLLDNVILSATAVHVTNANIEYLRNSLSSAFHIPLDTISLCVVGSAKLGFAVTEKRVGATVLPRYRLFSAYSDIDVVVISPPLFDLIWSELSAFSHRAARFPWNSGFLGDYLVCGWLRPDHFPIRERLRRCDDWWDLFRELSADPRYGRRKVRGGLFYSLEHMRRYQTRALHECALAESSGNI